MKKELLLTALSATVLVAAPPAMAQLGVATGVASPLAGSGSAVTSGSTFSARPALNHWAIQQRFLTSSPRHLYRLHTRKPILLLSLALPGPSFHWRRGKRRAHIFLEVGTGRIVELDASHTLLAPVVGTDSQTVSPPAQADDKTQQSERTPITLLVLKDGSIHAATHYWLKQGKIFYLTPVGTEQFFSAAELDLKRTIELNAGRGRSFWLEPLEWKNLSPAPKPSAQHLPVPVEFPGR